MNTKEMRMVVFHRQRMRMAVTGQVLPTNSALHDFRIIIKDTHFECNVITQFRVACP